MSGRRELTVFWQTLLIEHNECFYAVHIDSLVSDFGTDDAPDAATFARTEDRRAGNKARATVCGRSLIMISNSQLAKLVRTVSCICCQKCDGIFSDI